MHARNTRPILTRLLAGLLLPTAALAQAPVGDTPTAARSASGEYISWREHIIDDPASRLRATTTTARKCPCPKTRSSS